MKGADVIRKMYDNDAFSQWLGIEFYDEDLTKAALELTVREEMTNGFGIAHGGITYSLADSALAFACNSHGYHTFSIHTGIHHLKKVSVGDRLRTSVEEESMGRKVGVFNIKVTNQNDVLVATFKGMVYRSDQPW